jgi:hypothetical protein
MICIYNKGMSYSIHFIYHKTRSNKSKSVLRYDEKKTWVIETSYFTSLIVIDSPVYDSFWKQTLWHIYIAILYMFIHRLVFNWIDSESWRTTVIWWFFSRSVIKICFCFWQKFLVFVEFLFVVSFMIIIFWWNKVRSKLNRRRKWQIK